MTDGCGIFNLCAKLGACHVHEGGSGIDKSAQELTRRDRKTVPRPVCPVRGLNPGSSDLNSDALSHAPRIALLQLNSLYPSCARVFSCLQTFHCWPGTSLCWGLLSWLQSLPANCMWPHAKQSSLKPFGMILGSRCVRPGKILHVCVCPSQAIPQKLLKSPSSNLAQWLSASHVNYTCLDLPCWPMALIGCFRVPCWPMALWLAVFQSSLLTNGTVVGCFRVPCWPMAWRRRWSGKARSRTALMRK